MTDGSADVAAGAGGDGPGGGQRTLRIGEAAEELGVSARTLRWYEELGLLAPAGYSAGGARRYCRDDLDRVVHIRELQALLGFDLTEIKELLRAEDSLAGLRSEYRSGAGDDRRREILDEALTINARLAGLVAAKQARLERMTADLDAKNRRYRKLLRDLGRPAPR